MTMFSLDDAEISYEPYPICYAADVFPAGIYEQLADSYPDVGLFSYKPELGSKYSLSEKSNPDKYRAFLGASPAWSKFHDYVKSERFVRESIDFLAARNIDLGLKKLAVRSDRSGRPSSLMSRITRTTELSARFEFSMMGGQGGSIRPHTDDHRKLLTFVLSMVRPGEWDNAWGGGTQVCLPKDRSKIYNQMNKFLEFDEVEILNSYDFKPNQCILFIKTYNSWHQVAPLAAPAGSPMRKTLTINIEKLI